ncbi:hypothetical protein J1614_003801 [Plenodomus biglobosus]|nr:hypothetical protein J1614_003801 [Plenodomus biglobosus]
MSSTSHTRMGPNTHPSPHRPANRPKLSAMLFSNAIATLLSLIAIATLFWTSLSSTTARIIYGLLTFCLIRTSLYLHHHLVATERWIEREMVEVNAVMRHLACETEVNQALIGELLRLEDRGFVAYNGVVFLEDAEVFRMLLRGE